MRRWILILGAAAAAIIIPQVFIENELHARIVSIAAVCLMLWLSEATPPFVPTLMLWALVPLVLGPLDKSYTFPVVLSWAADPVLALFFGGFALGVAAERHRLDRKLIDRAIKYSGGSFGLLLLLVIFITAFLSMWMSNIAAAALMFACLRPALSQLDESGLTRRELLVGVALGADLGGMATPIGTGPNAVAIASLAEKHHISFLEWMIFAFPLTIGMLVVSFLYLRWRTRRADGITDVRLVTDSGTALDDRESVTANDSRIFAIVLAATVALWLTEPFHKIPSAVVSIGASAALFLTGILVKDSLKRIDWSTLILISGGITLGRLLEASSMISTYSSSVPFTSMHPTIGLFVICVFTAMLAALMSNTASVILMIPLATALVPDPTTAVLVAISASFGIPFIISTPPNAMAFGEGGLKFGDLFWPGIVLMLAGCLLISTTGPAVLRFAGVQ